jgi:hypothetical protein
MTRRRRFDALKAHREKIVSIIRAQLRYGQCMVPCQQTEPRDVASTASQVLIAWKKGQRPSLRDWRAQKLNALDTERMEVLESVVESLQTHDKLSSDRVRVAVRLLEHLAQAPAALAQE